MTSEKTEYQGSVYFKESRKVTIENPKGNWQSREGELSITRRYDDTDAEIPDAKILERLVKDEMDKWEEDARAEMKKPMHGASQGQAPSFQSKRGFVRRS